LNEEPRISRPKKGGGGEGKTGFQGGERERFSDFLDSQKPSLKKDVDFEGGRARLSGGDRQGGEIHINKRKEIRKPTGVLGGKKKESLGER